MKAIMPEPLIVSDLVSWHYIRTNQRQFSLNCIQTQGSEASFNSISISRSSVRSRSPFRFMFVSDSTNSREGGREGERGG